jgi:hypothetical protein
LPSALRLSVRRKACHKRNKRKQGKREDPLADMWSTRRRECVGTHFACGFFRQWGSGCLSDPKKCVTTEEKSSCNAAKLPEKTPEFMGVYSLFGSNCPVSKMSSLQHAFCQVVTIQMCAAKM